MLTLLQCFNMIYVNEGRPERNICKIQSDQMNKNALMLSFLLYFDGKLMFQMHMHELFLHIIIASVCHRS